MKRNEWIITGVVFTIFVWLSFNTWGLLRTVDHVNILAKTTDKHLEVTKKIIKRIKGYHND
jgi:hypothetical protein